MESKNNPRNDLDELREHLFDTLRGLKNKSIDVSQAKAISDVAQTIINTGKLELDFNEGAGSQLFNGEPPYKSTSTGRIERTHTGYVHKLR